MGLPKGRTNNPNGRPKKEECMSYLVSEYLNGASSDEDKVSRRTKLIEKAYGLGLKGDIPSIRLLWSYDFGLPKQSIEHTSNLINPLLEALGVQTDNDPDGD